MDAKRKRQEVDDLINNLKEHSDRLKDHPNIPELELNVYLSKITKLYEKTVVLKYLVRHKDKYSEKNIEERSIENKDEENRELYYMKEKDKTNQEEKENKASPKEHTTNKDISDKQNIDLPKEETVKQPTVPNQITDNPNVDQKIIGKIEDYIDVNSRFSQHEDPSLSHQLKKQPIANLMTAIGLNERYLFANQLFDGNMEAFIDEIKKLNSFDSEKEAMNYFDNELVKKNNWDKNDELVAGFRLLVERRFNQ